MVSRSDVEGYVYHYGTFLTAGGYFAVQWEDSIITGPSEHDVVDQIIGILAGPACEGCEE